NFDSDDFLLEDGHSIYGEDLEIEKNDKHSDWNETFADDKAKWCVVWTAAYQYWYGNNFGLKNPRSNSVSNMSLDIEVYYKNDTDFKNAIKDAGFEYDSSIYGFYVLSASTTYDDRILIRAKDRMSDGIFRSLIHEIAHFSLNTNQKSSLFYAEEENYRDTYTRGIEWYFINNRYCAGDLKSSCGIFYIRHYIGLVQDLVDANNDCADGFGTGSDKVSGFKIVDLENAFYASRNLDELKSYIIKNLKSGENGRSYTEKNLNMLFDYWKGSL
ncbi:MAG TPA: hypothetical protein GX707_09750, partial [Epulopiscium sp.]|nr:hypothetical protein [Candidatus Epulonipiscium sp.]